MENKLKERFPELESWKKQFAPRKLSVIEVEGKMCVLRPVTAKDVSAYSMSVAGTGGVEEASRYLLEELWLSGDNEIRDNEEYFISAMMQIQNVMELKKSSFTTV